MNTEKQLEYLLAKRRELQETLQSLKQECILAGVYEPSDEPIMPLKTAQIDKKTEYSAEWISLNCMPSKATGVSLTPTNGIFYISASDELKKHAYVYMSYYWSIKDVVENDSMSLSLVINAEERTSVRPLVVFYDRNKKKLSHSFFVFNVPTKFDVPLMAAYMSIGFRLEANDLVGIIGLQFKKQTLDELCDLQFINRIQEKINVIPVSNGSKYYEKCGKTFGLIADQFLFDAYKNTGNCIYITPNNYEEYLSTLDFLIVASAWHGLNNEWDGMTRSDTLAGKMIYTIIKKAKKKNIPVVFYSKEDPPNYEHFVGIAKACNYIFTSAYEMIDRYKKDCSTENVDSLCFCINPEFHNPIGICSVEPEEGVIFSGSWMTKYPDRVKKLESLFDGILKSGMKLKIIDRNFEKKDPRYYFPEKYYSCISPAIGHEVLQKVHKLYHWAVNINSVTDSKTMFANRVYELQAIGNLLLSNYSLGISEKFEGVFISENADEIFEILTSMSEEEIYRKRIQNVRRVMTGETTTDRLCQIMNTIGIAYEVTSRKVAVIIKEKSQKIVQCFEEQSYLNKVLLEESECTEENLSDIDIIAFWSPKFQYGKYYLEDMTNAFKYTACNYITKESYFEGEELHKGVEHNYVQKYSSKYTTIFWKENYSIEELLSFPEELNLENGYSIDRFELIKRG